MALFGAPLNHQLSQESPHLPIHPCAEPWRVESVDSVQDIEGSEFEGVHIDAECELEEADMNRELEVSEHI